MPKGIAVTRITPRNSKPENTCPNCGSGIEKPKLAKESPRPDTLRPPMLRPSAVEPQAIAEPTAIATSPAGIPP